MSRTANTTREESLLQRIEELEAENQRLREEKVVLGDILNIYKQSFGDVPTDIHRKYYFFGGP
jgi:hypothetical protein